MADGNTTKDPIGDASKTVHQNSESRKRSRSASAKPGAKEHIEVVAVDRNGAKIGSSPQTINTPTEVQSLTKVMQEGFANMSRTLANAIEKAFASFRSDFEVSYSDDNSDGSDHEVDEPPVKGRANVDSTNDASAALSKLLSKSSETTDTSNESKSSVLNNLKQDLQKDKTGPKVDTELADIINSLLKAGLPEEKIQEKMNKYHRPENCENLTKVRVNQEIWDNLSPPIRSQDVRMQKVQTSVYKGMCALAVMINKLLDHMPSSPGIVNGLLPEATDAFALLANANTELNHRRRELIKPDLHSDYKHLCSTSLVVTDKLFGDDLPKQVKDLTEVNRVGKKLTNNSSSGSVTRFRPDSKYHNRPRGYSGYRGGRKPFLGYRRCDRQQYNQNQRKKKEGNSK